MPKSERTLYVSRKLKNSDEFIDWAKGQGFSTTLPPEQLHVTVAFSREALEWPDPLLDEVVVKNPSSRSVKPLGDGGAVVLAFESSVLKSRWQELIGLGASWDWDGYQPHVTISWQADGVDLSEVEPFKGDLVFGSEILAEVNEDWRATVTEKDLDVVFKADVIGTNDEQHLVWGWGSVSTVGETDVVDLQDDLISPEELVKASTEFMEEVREAKVMHRGQQKGAVVHSLPLTKELATTLGVSSDREGWIVGVKIYDEETWKSVKDGELRAFSIGGSAVRETVE